ncbi:DNA-binding MarR family transcriptional regulator [Paenibacillus endophyticus]|uniref:DNA-binding MarR family transcriptional regulator n=1 Tax=Paenibacillus endophyticus TaxID=1294268 RepID=A0A7W5GB75_9BACL|nr:MarR family transcriptional regulator [Paenibacillus endophyticus]MBB3153505.1 DNA-binding MarR family transcriptional regulator [Paenibacillus endophyticus]
METKHNLNELNVSDFALVFEDLTRIFIRLPSIEKLSFTTLSVLHTLCRKSPMRLTELTANEQVTQSAITQLVTRLERDGLVERRPDPNDGRVVLVHITAQGANIIDSRRLERMKRISTFMDGLTLEEKQAIAAAMPSLRRLVELGSDS